MHLTNPSIKSIVYIMENGELNLIELAQHFSDEDKAREFIEKLALAGWPGLPALRRDQ